MSSEKAKKPETGDATQTSSIKTRNIPSEHEFSTMIGISSITDPLEKREFSEGRRGKSEASNGSHLALLVGIEHFESNTRGHIEDFATGLEQLKGASADANLIKETLCRQEYGYIDKYCAIDFVTKEQLKELVLEHFVPLAKQHPGCTLLLYISTHGFKNEAGTFCFCCTDTYKSIDGRIKNALPIKEFTSWFSDLYDYPTILIMDTCRTSVYSKNTITEHIPLQKDIYFSSSNWRLITAASPNQSAHELPSGDIAEWSKQLWQPSGNAPHGLFTLAFLKACHSKSTQDQDVSYISREIDNLIAYVIPSYGIEQKPYYMQSGNQKVQIFKKVSINASSAKEGISPNEKTIVGPDPTPPKGSSPFDEREDEGPDVFVGILQSIRNVLDKLKPEDEEHWMFIWGLRQILCGRPNEELLVPDIIKQIGLFKSKSLAGKLKAFENLIPKIPSTPTSRRLLALLRKPLDPILVELTLELLVHVMPLNHIDGISTLYPMLSHFEQPPIRSLVLRLLARSSEQQAVKTLIQYALGEGYKQEHPQLLQLQAVSLLQQPEGTRHGISKIKGGYFFYPTICYQCGKAVLWGAPYGNLRCENCSHEHFIYLIKSSNTDEEKTIPEVSFKGIFPQKQETIHINSINENIENNDDDDFITKPTPFLLLNTPTEKNPSVNLAMPEVSITESFLSNIELKNIEQKAFPKIIAPPNIRSILPPPLPPFLPQPSSTKTEKNLSIISSFSTTDIFEGAETVVSRLPDFEEGKKIVKVTYSPCKNDVNVEGDDDDSTIHELEGISNSKDK